MVSAAECRNWIIFLDNTALTCLLTETHLRSVVVFRMANYVCHRIDWLNEGAEQLY